MKDFWNTRYAQKEYVYGQEPNSFFKSFLTKQKKQGKLLLPAEGEGRNAVYAASLGWEVEAFDFSREAMYKAFQLAKKRNLVIKYKVVDLEKVGPFSPSFDIIGLFYAHMEPELREQVHQHLLSALLPGGKIILEGFSKAQQGKHSGGPKRSDMLFCIDDMLDDFSSLTFELLEEREVDLAEGRFHQGSAHVIRMIGKKMIHE